MQLLFIINQTIPVILLLVYLPTLYRSKKKHLHRYYLKIVLSSYLLNPLYTYLAYYLEMLSHACFIKKSSLSDFK